jgi:hypothetical protein
LTASVYVWTALALVVVLPLSILIRMGAIGSSNDEQRVEAEDQNSDSGSAVSLRAKLVISALLLAAVLASGAFTYLFLKYGWDEWVGNLVFRLAQPALPLLAIAYLLVGVAIRRRRLRRWGKSGHRDGGGRPMVSATIGTVLDGESNVDWSPYAATSLRRGRVLLVAGLVLQLSCIAAAVLILFWGFSSGFRAHRLIQMFGFLTSAVVVYVVVNMTRAARPHYARSELRRMLSSGMPPVLYLRPFDADAETFENVGSVFQNPMCWVDWRAEEVIAKVVRQRSPFLALGDPKHGLLPTPLAAGRLYVSGDWQRTVLRVLEVSRLNIVRASLSPSVVWELNEVLRADRRHRAALLLVSDDGKPMGEAHYSRFREHLARSFGVELPQDGWNSWYVWFDRLGEGHTVGTDCGESDDALREATNELIQQRVRKEDEEWPRLSVWDYFVPLEYRLLAWGPLAALAAWVAILVLY